MIRAPSGISSTGEAGGIAPAVEALVVVADHRDDHRIAEAGGHVGAVARVAADDLELLLGEPAGLVEDLARGVELADVVQRGGGADLGDLRVGEPHPARDPLGMPRHPLRVAVGVAVARLERGAQLGQCLDVQALGVFADERLGAGEPPLGAGAAQPAPQHQVGEHHVARARRALPQRRAGARREDGQQHSERDREREQRRVARRHDRPDRERRQDHDERGGEDGKRQTALRVLTAAPCGENLHR